MPRNSQSQSDNQPRTIFSWLRSHHHRHENNGSDSRGGAQHHGRGNSQSESPGDVTTGNVPRERHPPPSYQSVINSRQAPTSAAQNPDVIPSPSASETPNTAPPADTPPPAWYEETPPPSYEDATEGRPHHVRFGNTNTFITNAPVVAANYLNARGSNSTGDLNLSRGISITTHADPNGSTVRNITISGRNRGGIQVGSVSGAEITMGSGGISIQARRTDERGNVFTHTFSSSRGGVFNINGEVNIGGARNVTNIDSRSNFRRPRSPSQRRSARSSAEWGEDESSESDSDEDDRWYVRDGNRGGL